jgi:hypothetical protein
MSKNNHPQTVTERDKLSHNVNLTLPWERPHLNLIFNLLVGGSSGCW